MGRMRIGVIGYRNEPVDKHEARTKLDRTFDDIANNSPDVTNFEVIVDALNLGISPLAVTAAEARRWMTWGLLRSFDPADYKKYGVLDVDGVIDRYYHDGDVILQEVAVLVRIGGSRKRCEWAEQFRKNGGCTYEHDLTSM